MSALFVTLMLNAAGTPALEAALRQAVTREGARVELTAWEAPTCRGAFAPAAFDASGRVPVRVRGGNCDAWGWATVRVSLPVPTLTRDVKANESMDGAWTMVDGEPRGGALTSIPAGATATRWLRKGASVNAADVHVGPRLGTAVTVRVMLGALSLEQRGTVAACSGGNVCATLPSGKKVSGVWTDGALLVGGGT